jgi:hypothetical protein
VLAALARGALRVWLPDEAPALLQASLRVGRRCGFLVAPPDELRVWQQSDPRFWLMAFQRGGRRCGLLVLAPDGLRAWRQSDPRFWLMALQRDGQPCGSRDALRLLLRAALLDEMSRPFPPDALRFWLRGAPGLGEQPLASPFHFARRARQKHG